MISPIRIQSVSKSYRIYKNPQDRFKQAFASRWRSVLGGGEGHAQTDYYREHWALRDISFELRPGEAFGILGRNGAGKSTLLQIIAGTLSPTSGTVETNGRITALLELGSGFNLEFTGRENVFMNAAILGLSRDDTERRFDEIAAFADIGDFIDQPVKTYSSGMMMRLAFSVQTAVQPSVLIVDEALGVGDMFFQAKCKIRLRQLIDAGVTLLFVSHDVGTVRQICQRAILLHEGGVIAMDSAGVVADQYEKYELENRNRSSKRTLRVSDEAPYTLRDSNQLTPMLATARPDTSKKGNLSPVYSKNVVGSQADDFGVEAFRLRANLNRVGNGDAEIFNVHMLRNGVQATSFDYDEEVCIRVYVRFNRGHSNVNMSIKVRTLQGIDILYQDTRLMGEMSRIYESEKIYIFEWLIKLPIMHGNYGLSCGLAIPPEIAGEDWLFVDIVQQAHEFRMLPRAAGMISGFVNLPARLLICEQFTPPE